MGPSLEAPLLSHARQVTCEVLHPSKVTCKLCNLYCTRLTVNRKCRVLCRE